MCGLCFTRDCVVWVICVGDASRANDVCGPICASFASRAMLCGACDVWVVRICCRSCIMCRRMCFTRATVVWAFVTHRRCISFGLWPMLLTRACDIRHTTYIMPWPLAIIVDMRTKLPNKEGFVLISPFICWFISHVTPSHVGQI